MSNRTKKGIAIASVLAVAALLGAWILIPTADISPAAGQSDIPLGRPVTISSSPLSGISKVTVYADGEPLALEYNLGAGDLVRDFGLKAGQEIRIETKVSSVIGFTREFTSTFTTVGPVIVDAVSVDGEPLKAGQRIAPQSTLVFSFNKPLNQAAVSLDGSEAIDLQIDPDDPTRASLPPMVSFKQGATLLLKIMATATDSATLEPREVRAGVVKPLSLYGRVDEEGGRMRIELDATTAFADPAAVRAALETTLPDPEITVEKQKIVIICPGLDQANEYSVNLARADGADGSFLETPLKMTVSFKADPSQAAASSGSGYRGYVYTTGSPESNASAGSGEAAGSGPPPGWPSCCPWPPQ